MKDYVENQHEIHRHSTMDNSILQIYEEHSQGCQL